MGHSRRAYSCQGVPNVLVRGQITSPHSIIPSQELRGLRALRMHSRVHRATVGRLSNIHGNSCTPGTRRSPTRPAIRRPLRGIRRRWKPHKIWDPTVHYIDRAQRHEQKAVRPCREVARGHVPAQRQARVAGPQGHTGGVRHRQDQELPGDQRTFAHTRWRAHPGQPQDRAEGASSTRGGCRRHCDGRGSTLHALPSFSRTVPLAVPS